MTSYRSPFLGIPAAPAPSEVDLTWDRSEPEPDYEDDPPYNPHGYRYIETTAGRLQRGQMMCWTEDDGFLAPPRKVAEVYNKKHRYLVLESDGNEDHWTIREFTRVGYLDTTPVYNDWGEEGL